MTIDWRAELERQTLQTLGQFQNPAPTIGGVGRTLLQALGSRRPYGEVAAEREAADLNRSAAIVQLLSGQAQAQSAAEEAAYQHEQDAAQMGLDREKMAVQADQFGQSLGMQQQGLDIQRQQLGVQEQEAVARQVAAFAEQGHEAAKYLMDLTTQAGIPVQDMSRVIADVTLAAQADGSMTIEELPAALQATMQKFQIVGAAPASALQTKEVADPTSSTGRRIVTETAAVGQEAPAPTPLMQSVSPFVAQYEEGQADIATSLDAAGTQAQSDLDVISQMATQLKDGLDTGALQPTLALIQSVAQDAFGLNLQEVAAAANIKLNNIGSAQELARLNASMVSTRVLESDAAKAFSDADREALTASLAGLGLSNEGNRLALAAMQAAAERKAEQARRWHMVRNATTDPNLLDNAWYDFQATWEDYAKANPIQADIDRLLAASPAPTGGQPGSGSSGLSIGEAATIAPTTGGLPTVANQAAFDALRSGAHFLDPNGVERVKP